MAEGFSKPPCTNPVEVSDDNARGTVYPSTAMDIDLVPVLYESFERVDGLRESLSKLIGRAILHGNVAGLDSRLAVVGLQAMPIDPSGSKILLALEIQDRRDPESLPQPVNVLGAGRTGADEEMRKNLVRIHTDSEGFRFRDGDRPP